MARRTCALLQSASHVAFLLAVLASEMCGGRAQYDDYLDYSQDAVLNELSQNVDLRPPIRWDQDGMVTSLNWHYVHLRTSIPESISALSRLTLLDLGDTWLDGSLPSTMSTLSSLQDLSLGSNSLTGSIPAWIANLTALTALQLDKNRFEGSMPSELATLTNLRTLRLGFNDITGQLPDAFSALTNLNKLGLAETQLSGSVPGISRMTSLTELHLAADMDCPESFSGCSVECWELWSRCFLFCSACAFGSAPAPVPPFTGSGELDSSSSGMSNSNSSSSGGSGGSSSGLSAGAIVGLAAACACLVVALVLLVLLLVHRSKKRGAKQNASPAISPVTSAAGAAAAAASGAAAAAASASAAAAAAAGAAASPERPIRELTMGEVKVATDNWARSGRMVTRGSFDVYRGFDPSNPAVPWAVCRARVLSNTFRQSVERMGAVRHPNLVRLVGFCMEMTPSALQMEQVTVYPLFAHGDLEKRLRPGSSSSEEGHAPLSLGERLGILEGVARGLECLHASGIVHRDVKPSNVLLDTHLQPHIVDYGFIKSAQQGTVDRDRAVGTPGYLDPAYAKSLTAAPSADVYSFGVVILEVVSGHKCFFRDGDRLVPLPQWASQKVDSNALMEVCEASLHIPTDTAQDLVLLALRCTAIAPDLRPTMAEVAQELDVLVEQCRAVQMGGERDHAVVDVQEEQEVDDGVDPR